jgi:hypothetical protein
LSSRVLSAPSPVTLRPRAEARSAALRSDFVSSSYIGWFRIIDEKRPSPVKNFGVIIAFPITSWLFNSAEASVSPMSEAGALSIRTASMYSAIKLVRLITASE